MLPRLTAYYFTVYKYACPNETAPLFTVYHHTLFQGLKMALVRLPPHKFARPPMITGKRCKYTNVTLLILNSVKVGLPVQNSKWRGIKTPWRSHKPTFFFRTEEENIRQINSHPAKKKKNQSKHNIYNHSQGFATSYGLNQSINRALYLLSCIRA